MMERPILFSSPMVRAILESRKTVTRRLVKPQPPFGTERFATVALCPPTPTKAVDWLPVVDGATDYSAAPLRQIATRGDRLWVRETWFDDFGGEEQPRDRNSAGAPDGIVYRADHDCTSWEAGCPCNPDGKGKRGEWRPSSQMPRWASRITLEVVDIRVERLHEITEEDAKAEGTPRVDGDPDEYPCLSCDLGVGPKLPKGSIGCADCSNSGVSCARAHFAALWDSTNGKRAPWSSNPWVWRVEFKKVKP